ncbi:MAG: PAC2 family protein [SAR202 cluster bacterium]|nr:PAC2 family protein [SAR202 cluster bacterium]
MEIGAFHVELQGPPLRSPHMVAMLRPWVNVGNVGSIVLGRLNRTFGGEEIGRLARPGKFYDFTRYRPEMKLVDGERTITTPNTVVIAARRETPPDLLLVHLLEPHSHAEDYNDSVVELMSALKVETYVLVGGMYDSLPHTRPLVVTGSARGWETAPDLGDVKLRRSSYEGPTSAVNQVPQRALEMGMKTLSLLVHLPMYLQLENDFAGAARLLEGLAPLYGLPLPVPEAEIGASQYEQVTPAVIKNPELAELVTRMEKDYDARPPDAPRGSVRLSPEIEKFLDDIRKSGEGGGPTG